MCRFQYSAGSTKRAEAEGEEEGSVSSWKCKVYLSHYIICRIKYHYKPLVHWFHVPAGQVCKSCAIIWGPPPLKPSPSEWLHTHFQPLLFMSSGNLILDKSLGSQVRTSCQLKWQRFRGSWAESFLILIAATFHTHTHTHGRLQTWTVACGLA